MSWTKLVPKTIKVGSRTYSIVLLDPRKAASDSIYGRQDAQCGTIELDSMMTEDNARVYLMHEIMHAVYNEHCMYNAASLQPKDVEEFIVDNMSKGYTTVLRDNPKLNEFYKKW